MDGVNTSLTVSRVRRNEIPLVPPCSAADMTGDPPVPPSPHTGQLSGDSSRVKAHLDDGVKVDERDRREPHTKPLSADLITEIRHIKAESDDIFRQFQKHSQEFVKSKKRHVTLIGIGNFERNSNLQRLMRQERIHVGRTKDQAHAKPALNTKLLQFAGKLKKARAANNNSKKNTPAEPSQPPAPSDQSSCREPPRPLQRNMSMMSMPIRARKMASSYRERRSHLLECKKHRPSITGLDQGGYLQDDGNTRRRSTWTLGEESNYTSRFTKEGQVGMQERPLWV